MRREERGLGWPGLAWAGLGWVGPSTSLPPFPPTLFTSGRILPPSPPSSLHPLLPLYKGARGVPAAYTPQGFLSYPWRSKAQPAKPRPPAAGEDEARGGGNPL